MLEVTQYTATVESRSAVILRVDCETMRIIGAESAQVKFLFMMVHKVEHVMVDEAAFDKFC